MTAPRVSRVRRRWAAVGPVVLVLGALLAHRAGWIDIGEAPGGSDRRPAPVEAGREGGPPVGIGAGGDIETAYRERRSDVWVEASGVVFKLLPDDRDGDPHQKFLVRVDGSKLTVLIAHSLNAAERVPVRDGDRLRFRGEYEWTEKGGTIHFTHAPEFERRDPGGWIEHDGKRIE